MDYAAMLLDHVRLGAKVTVACIEVPRCEASAFGVMDIDEQRKIRAFVEKPANPPAMPGCEDRSLASMGIYIFEAEYLYQLLEEGHPQPGVQARLRHGRDPASWGGQGICPPVQHVLCRGQGRAKPYWRDVGTLDSFWEANMDLASRGARARHL